jgi:hypothetical protein
LKGCVSHLGHLVKGKAVTPGIRFRRIGVSLGRGPTAMLDGASLQRQCCVPFVGPDTGVPITQHG